ncbi:MAG: hypothetical protein OXM55_07090 [Bdellovibrionales bacterium]|nr:hypothetical protein [Bdellovibrionales bacterium]
MKKILLITGLILLINPSLTYGQSDLGNDIMATRNKLNSAIISLDKLVREIGAIRETLNRADLDNMGSALRNEYQQSTALKECQQQLNQQN